MGNSVLLTCHTVCTTLNYLIVFYILLLQVYKGLSAVTEVWIVLMVRMRHLELMLVSDVKMGNL